MTTAIINEIETTEETMPVTYSQKQYKNIPLPALIESHLNSDRIITDEMVAEMIEDLKGTDGALTVKIPFLVTPADKEGNHGVIDGKTRLRSLIAAVEQKLTVPETIPCLILTDAQVADQFEIDRAILQLGKSNNKLKPHEMAHILTRLVQRKTDDIVTANNKEGDEEYRAKCHAKAVKAVHESLGLSKVTVEKSLRYTGYTEDTPDLIREATVSGVIAGMFDAIELWQKYKTAVEKFGYDDTLQSFIEAGQSIVGFTSAKKKGDVPKQKPVNEAAAEEVLAQIKNAATNAVKAAAAAAEKAKKVTELREKASALVQGDLSVIPLPIMKAIDNAEIKPEALEKFAEVSSETGKTVLELFKAVLDNATTEGSEETPMIDDRVLNRTQKEAIATAKKLKDAADKAKSDFADVPESEIIKNIASIANSIAAYGQSPLLAEFDKDRLVAMFNIFTNADKKIQTELAKKPKAAKSDKNPPVVDDTTSGTDEATAA